MIDLAREFKFYDHDINGFIDSRHLSSILGYFDLSFDTTKGLKQFFN